LGICIGCIVVKTNIPVL